MVDQQRTIWYFITAAPSGRKCERLKRVKISKNLYYNLLPGRGEQRPNIDLETPNDARVIFAIAELLKARQYRLNDDKEKTITVEFKEIHAAFAAGRKRVEPSETVEAFERLRQRAFDLVVKDGSDKIEILSQKHLFDFEGNLREIKRLQISRIFYRDIEKYFSFSENFLTILFEAAKAISGPQAKLTKADIILSLYVKQYSHTDRPDVQKSIKDIAKWAGMEANVKERRKTETEKTITRSAQILKHIQLIQDFSVNKEKNNITLIFPEAPKREREKKD